MDKTLRFVWAHMIERGHLTTGRWSYYGGDWEYPPDNNYRQIDANEKKFREDVKKIGVDWEKTKEPESSIESAFTDTFHDADSVETLLGTIVLKNGKEYMIGVGNSEIRFGEYVRIIREQLANEHRMKDIFGE